MSKKMSDKLRLSRQISIEESVSVNFNQYQIIKNEQIQFQNRILEKINNFGDKLIKIEQRLKDLETEIKGNFLFVQIPESIAPFEYFMFHFNNKWFKVQCPNIIPQNRYIKVVFP